MNEQQIEQLKKIGSEWKNHGKHRIYFNDDLKHEIIGLDVDYYKSGNVSGATLNGERISNSEARRVMSKLGSMYYDFSDQKFHGPNNEYFFQIVDGIKARLGE